MPERRFRYAERIAEQGLSPPDEFTMHLLWQIVDEGVLGASNHVRLSQELLIYLVNSVADPREAWLRTECAARFVAKTRGEEAPVVGNALRLLTDGLKDLPPGRRKAALRRRIDDWQADAERRLCRLLSTAVKTIGTGHALIAYDYSSTVAAVVEALCLADRDTRVIIPESRAIAGGRRYLEAFSRAGIAVRFVPDAAFEQILVSDAVILLGAESIRCDGSLLNTIGSRPLARLARWRGCPVFACADLLKLDLRSYHGIFAEPSLRDFDHLLEDVTVPEGAQISTMGPELEVVPAELITGFLSDHGPLPPGAIWSLGREVFKITTGGGEN